MGEYIVPILVALVASSPGLYAIYRGRRKQSADAAEIYERIARSVGEQMERLQARVETLEEQVVTYERTLTEWREGIEKLLCQMAEQGVDPVWTPPPDSHEIPSRPRKRK